MYSTKIIAANSIAYNNAFMSLKTCFKFSVSMLPIYKSNDIISQINLNCEVN